MALHEKSVQVAAGDNCAVAIERDTIIDPQSGLAVQVEKITAAVDLGDGNVAVRQQQRVIGVAASTTRQVC